MAALSFNNRRQKSTTTTTWATQRQQLFVRKQYSFIETSNCNNSNNHNNNINNKGRGSLTRGLSVGRSYDGIRQKFNAPSVSLRHAGSQAYLQRQITFDQDLKFHKNNSNNIKSKENFLKNSRITNNSRFNNFNNNENLKSKQKGIVAWSSTSSLLKSFDDDHIGNSRTKIGEGLRDTRKASTTTSNSTFNNQRSHSLSKGEVSKINLSIVLPQAVKTSIDEIIFSDIESSLDSGVDTDTASSQPSKLKTLTKTKTTDKTTTLTTTTATPTTTTTTLSNTAGYRRAQFRSSRNTETAGTILATTNNQPTIVTTTTTAVTTTNATTTSDANKNSFTTTTITSTVSPTTPTFSSPSSSLSTSTSTSTITTPTALATTTFSASPSLTVQRRPPLVRAMSAPVRPLDDSSKGAFAANKRKPRRRKIITRNISCDKTTEQEFLTTTEIINGKKVLTRSRSTVATDVITLVSLMSSEGSDSEKEDLIQTPTTTTAAGNSTRSEKSPVKRAPSLRKTGKSVSFQENYPPNFQLASKEYSHMIRRGSIAPLTARIRTNRPPTAPPVSIFLNMSNSNTETFNEKIDNSNTESNIENRTPMCEQANNKTDQNAEEYIFPDYVRSIKERECWKLYQKMCTKGVNVSYDTILRGMLTPTEFRQIQKQREIEEAKARELLEAENETENVKPQSAIDRLSEALLKK